MISKQMNVITFVISDIKLSFLTNHKKIASICKHRRLVNRMSTINFLVIRKNFGFYWKRHIVRTIIYK